MTESLTSNLSAELRNPAYNDESDGHVRLRAADELDRLTEALTGAYASVNLLTEMHKKAVAEVAELRRDAERLDFLDGNKRFKTGWEVGVAPVGLISVRGIGLGTKSIREAIDAARLGEQP